MADSPRIRVFEVVEGTWTHTLTDRAWEGQDARANARIDAERYRAPGERVHDDFPLALQERAKRMNVDLYAKADKKQLNKGLPPEKPFDPFELSKGTG